MKKSLFTFWLSSLLLIGSFSLLVAQRQNSANSVNSVYPARNYNRRPPPPAPPVSEGHRLITRALWKIFDALMEKKENAERMSKVEAALKTVITSDTKLEDSIQSIKDDIQTLKAQTGTMMAEVEKIQSLKTRLAALEEWQLITVKQGDQNIHALPAHTGCPEQFTYVEGECFYVSQDTKLAWQDARLHCGKLGGDLASPNRLVNLQNHLISLKKRPEYVWIGATKLDGIWTWVASREKRPLDMSYNTWNDDLPSGIGDCVGLYEGAKYRAYDYDCVEEDYFVCQYFL